MPWTSKSNRHCGCAPLCVGISSYRFAPHFSHFSDPCRFFALQLGQMTKYTSRVTVSFSTVAFSGISFSNLGVIFPCCIPFSEITSGSCSIVPKRGVVFSSFTASSLLMHLGQHHALNPQSIAHLEQTQSPQFLFVHRLILLCF